MLTQLPTVRYPRLEGAASLGSALMFLGWQSLESIWPSMLTPVSLAAYGTWTLVGVAVALRVLGAGLKRGTVCAVLSIALYALSVLAIETRTEGHHRENFKPNTTNIPTVHVDTLQEWNLYMP